MRYLCKSTVDDIFIKGLYRGGIIGKLYVLVVCSSFLYFEGIWCSPDPFGVNQNKAKGGLNQCKLNLFEYSFDYVLHIRSNHI